MHLRVTCRCGAMAADALLQVYFHDATDHTAVRCYSDQSLRCSSSAQIDTLKTGRGDVHDLIAAPAIHTITKKKAVRNAAMQVVEWLYSSCRRSNCRSALRCHPWLRGQGDQIPRRCRAWMAGNCCQFWAYADFDDGQVETAQTLFPGKGAGVRVAILDSGIDRRLAKEIQARS